MARMVHNAKLNPRREPYWTVISAGCAVGYRRGAKGGTWVARMREGTKQQPALGFGLKTSD
ncbi:hypothetical protein LFADAHJC_LOCUS200 [Methylorubrum extorquens]